MIELGISSATFYPMLTEDAVDQIIRLGYRKAEIFLNSECEFAPDYIQTLREHLDNGGVEVVSVHPYTSAIEALYFFTAYPRRVNDALRIYERYFTMAERLGARYFTLHGDRNVTASTANSLSAVPKELHLEVLSRMADLAAAHGIIITQENVSWCASRNPDYIRMLRAGLGNRIGFTLDIKQARRAQVDIYDYLDAMGDRLLNIHISDYNEQDSCLLPGNGIMDYQQFVQYLRKIDYHGSLILETYSTAFDDIRQIESSKLLLENEIYHNLKK